MTDSDSNSNSGAVAAGGDRLSRLGDAALGHILSFLPAADAARAAALSRQWRHVFPAVHTLSFREVERPFAMGYRWFRLCSYCDPCDPSSPASAPPSSAVSMATRAAATPGTPSTGGSRC
ncbi:unnamed protein product [Urochloa humidicola]